MTILNLPTPPITPLPDPILHPYYLGASLYMPATRADLWQVITRQKLADVDSIIICLEDAVSECDVSMAIGQLQALLGAWADTPPVFSERPLVFIRPRNPLMLARMAEWANIGLVDGFVLPKVDMLTLADWRLAWQQLDASQVVMPTLETAQIFNPSHNHELAMALMESFGESILALRVGGNDLFSCLRLRRPRHTTIYHTPIGTLIHQLLGCFVPYGFYLTAPVFEYFDNAILAQEVAQDVALGFVGKTVIHPSQIATVKQALAVDYDSLLQAQAILATDAKAVFKQDNAMLEPATHALWADAIVKRQQIYGVKHTTH